MILIIGGMGFVGTNTAHALLDAGQDCVLTQFKNDRVPASLQPFVGKRIFIESMNVLDPASVQAVGKKHDITGIVNLVTGGGRFPAPGTGPVELLQDIHETVTSLGNALQAAGEWGVKRVTMASAPVVYNGVTELPWQEDHFLPLSAAYPMEAGKKTTELLADYTGRFSDIECVVLRLPAMYGPHYDATRAGFVGRLVHAAVKGETPDIGNLRFGSAKADDGGDQCYIKDAARAIALLQTADKLNHSVYNIATGQATTNRQVVDAIKKVIPQFQLELPAGRTPDGLDELWRFDITRLRQDTGYEPAFDIDAGIADYIAWLRAGNER